MAADVSQQIERLRREIREHDRKYYVEAAPAISDREYDHLMDRLRKLEADHPELITPDSPTQRIGDAPIESLSPVEHRIPMLSIENTYSVDELRSYGQRIAKLLPGESIEWVVELKIDGVAVSITYENGLLVRGATRGNGRVGDDITHNIRTLRSVPQRLSGDRLPKLLEVRGEVYMNNSDLVWLNEQQQKHGLPAYANTRNVAAGSIRLFDPRICAERRLRMFCHGVGYSDGVKAATHMEFLAEISQLWIDADAASRMLSRFRRGGRSLRGIDRAVARIGFRSRWAGAESQSFRSAAAIGLHVEKPALDHRLQVREIRSDNEARSDPRSNRQDGHDHASGRSIARRTGRHGRPPGQSAQCRRNRAKGYSRRRRGGRRKGGQSDSAYRSRRKTRADGGTGEVSSSRPNAPSVARRW